MKASRATADLPNRGPTVRPTSRHDGRLPSDHRVRRCAVALFVGASLASALGLVLDSMWLLTADAWQLIAAVTLELVYRP